MLVRSQWLPFTGDLVMRMDVPPAHARISLIDRAISDLIDAGVWARLDCLWAIAAHDAQAARLNWKGPGANDLSPVNDPIFTVDGGYAKNPGQPVSCLATGFFVGDGRTNRDSVYAGAYLATNASAGTNAQLLGNFGGAVEPSVIIRPELANGNIYTTCNADTISNTASPGATGYFAVSRTAGDQYRLHHGGGLVAAYGVASTGVVASEPIGLLNRGAPGAGAQMDGRIALAAIGAGLTEGEHETFYEIMVEGYLAEVGAVG